MSPISGSPAAAGRRARRPADFQLAEIRGEIVQLRVAQVLVVKYQYGVPVDRLPDRVDRGPVDTLAKVDAADFGNEVRIDLANLDGHGAPSVSSGEDPPASRPCQLLEARSACRNCAHGRGKEAA